MLNKFSDFKSTRFMFTANMSESVSDQDKNLIFLKQVISITVIILENKADWVSHLFFSISYNVTGLIFRQHLTTVYCLKWFSWYIWSADWSCRFSGSVGSVGLFVEIIRNELISGAIRCFGSDFRLRWLISIRLLRFFIIWLKSVSSRRKHFNKKCI